MKVVDVDIIVVKQINKILCNNSLLLFVIYTQVLADFAYSAYFDAVDS